MWARAGITLWLGCVLTALALASPALAARHLRPSPAQRSALPALTAPLTKVSGIGHAVARAQAAAGPTVNVGTLPTGVALTNTRAYVANSLSNTVSVVSLTTTPATVVATIPVGTFPISVALSPDGTRAYVSNFRSGSLSIIDTARQAVIATVRVGTAPEGVVQIGHRVYVANFLSHSISIVDPVAGAVTGTISLAGTPAPDPSGLAAAADGRHLSVDDTHNDRIDVIDGEATPPGKVGGAAVGVLPAYVAINGTTAYVANPNVASSTAGTVSVVDESNPAKPTVTRTVAVGSRPFGVAVLPSAGEVLASNSGDGTVSVISVATDAVTGTLGVGRTPDAIGVSPDQRTVAVTNEGDNTLTILRPPAAGPVSFGGAVGNTTFGVGTSPSQPSTTTSGTVLSNSSDPNGGTLTATPGSIITNHGGTVAMNANGTFTYHPPAGFTGTDTFSFQVDNGVSAATATASVTVVGRVWYVNDASATNGSGTSVSPFNTLASVTGPSGPTATTDSIFLFGSVTPYGGGITLKAGQLLIGQSATLTIGGKTVSAASGANPTITNSSGTGVTLAEGDTVTGITVSGTSGTGVSASGVNAFTLSSGDAISNAGTYGLEIVGGNGTVSALATISGAAGHSVDVQSRTGGTVTFGAPITDKGTGILLLDNTGATIDFTAPISASTGSRPAFQALGGGTVNVTGATNTLATTTGGALDVENTTIGASGLTFESISAGTSSTGPLNGVLLHNTGTTGPFTVTGVGTIAGSGGIIEHATDSTALGGEIAVDTTGPVSLSNMTVDNATENGIGAHDPARLTLIDNQLNVSGTVDKLPGDGISYVIGAIGLSTDASPSQFDIVGNHVTGMAGSDVFVYAGGIGTVTGHITHNIIGTPAGSSSGSTTGEGIDVFSDGNGGTVTADVSDNTVTGIAKSYGILGAAQDNQGGTTQGPVLNLTLTGNNVDLESTAALDGLNVTSGFASTPPAPPPPPLPAAVCLNATGNTSVSQGLVNPSDGMSVYQVTDLSVFRIVGGPTEIQPAPTPPDFAEDTSVETFLNTANPGLQANSASGSQASIAAQFGASGFTSATSCPTAPAAALSRKAATMVRSITGRRTIAPGHPSVSSSRASAGASPTVVRRRHGGRRRHGAARTTPVGRRAWPQPPAAVPG